ncbi:hypothetical protein [Parafrankia sp. CH37]|nr:hypothetical protein [Parafrankia sp. CH37]
MKPGADDPRTTVPMGLVVGAGAGDVSKSWATIAARVETDSLANVLRR